MTVDLADRLIADVQGSQDELPLIQHGLMRLWELAGATAGDPHSPRRLDLPLYEAHGPLARMLDPSTTPNVTLRRQATPRPAHTRSGSKAHLY